jgi:hypothetical protein
VYRPSAEADTKISLAGEFTNLPEFDRHPWLKPLLGLGEGLYFGMKESLDAGYAGASAGPIVGVEILLPESVFPSLEHKRIGFDQTAVAIV